MVSINKRQQRVLADKVSYLDAARNDGGQIRQEPATQAILSKVATGVTLSDEEASSLEAIILRDLRPILPIENGRVEVTANSPFGPSLVATRPMLEPLFDSVGRITVDGLPSRTWLGSCFVVADGVVATTRHIADRFAERDPTGRWAFRKNMAAAVDFGDGSNSLAVIEIVLVHPVLDFALLRIELSPSVPRLPLRLDASSRSTMSGGQVAVIGFGLSNPGGSILLPQPESKLLAPGELLGLTHYTVGTASYLSIAHDCSTIVGMSGAPLIDLQTGSVVGIHFARSESLTNHAVPISEMAREPRLGSLGLMFSEPLTQIDPNAWGEAWAEIERRPEPPATATLPPAASVALPVEPTVEQIDEALTKKYPVLDDLVSFLKGIGPSFEQAVNAQPRGRSSDENYRFALITAIKRRSLVDQDFLRKIGLFDTGAQPGAAQAAISEQEIAELTERLNLNKIRGASLNSMLLGSPYWDQLAEGAKPRLIPQSLTYLAGSSDPKARDAMVWLLNRIRLLASEEKGDGRAVHAELAAMIVRLGGAVQAAVDLGVYLPTAEDILDLSFFEAGIAASKAVGMIRHTAQSGGTCWLIAPGLVVCAAHVLDPPYSGGDDQQPPANAGQGSLADLQVSFEQPGGEPAHFAVKEITYSSRGLDVALLRLDEAPAIAPLRIRTTPVAEGGVTSIHHPGLLSKKVSALGGRLISNDGHECIYLLATAPGSGGAPIFDRDWKVVATHRAATTYHLSEDQPKVRVKIGTSIPALVDAIRTSPGGEHLWREIVGAQRDLRSIDASLLGLAASAEAKPRSVLIELVDDNTALPEITGLTPTQRTGRIVTALADPTAIDRLVDIPGIVAIEASDAAGSAECAISMPAIGVPLIHDQHRETGAHALIGIIDNGIDIHHGAFLGTDSHTRIEAFWDQQDPRGPADVETVTMSAAGKAMAEKFKLRGGALYLGSDIDRMLGDPQLIPVDFPAPSLMKHGTSVASIAAGQKTGEGPDHFPYGAAPAAKLAVVRYDLDGESVGSSGGHVQALIFIDQLAEELGLPAVVNISNGMNSGAHDGSSKVEVACDNFTGSGQKPGRVIVKSAGNEWGQARHARFGVRTLPKKLRWQTTHRPGSSTSRSLTERIELWFPRDHQYRFVLEAPDGGGRCSPVSVEFQKLDEKLGNGNLASMYYSPIRKENAQAMLEVSISKGDAPAVVEGTWTLTIEPVKVVTDRPINAWMEQLSNRDNFFLDDPVNECTITVPGTSEHVITVGAIEAGNQLGRYDRSSMGPTVKGVSKPELSAPGVGIRTAKAGSIDALTEAGGDGTSLATPHVTGVIALVLSARKLSGKPMLEGTIIRGLLLDSLKNFAAVADNQTGHGILDADAFFEAALNY